MQRKPLTKQGKKDVEAGAIHSISLGNITFRKVTASGLEETIRLGEKFYELTDDEARLILRILTAKAEAQTNQLRQRERDLPENARIAGWLHTA